jgi:hypothetical protein
MAQNTQAKATASTSDRPGEKLVLLVAARLLEIAVFCACLLRSGIAPMAREYRAVQSRSLIHHRQADARYSRGGRKLGRNARERNGLNDDRRSVEDASNAKSNQGRQPATSEHCPVRIGVQSNCKRRSTCARSLALRLLAWRSPSLAAFGPTLPIRRRGVRTTTTIRARIADSQHLSNVKPTSAASAVIALPIPNRINDPRRQSMIVW